MLYCLDFPAGLKIKNINIVIILYTGCSLNIVSFFRKFQNIFRTPASLGFPVLCTRTIKWQVENQRCSRTGRVQKKSQNFKEKNTIFNEHPVFHTTIDMSRNDALNNNDDNHESNDNILIISDKCLSCGCVARFLTLYN